MSSLSLIENAEVLIVNLHPRYAGVAATMRALVPVQQRSRPTVFLDWAGMGLSGSVGLRDVLRYGWTVPDGVSYRVWHARRAPDLALGLILGKVLGQPWKFVYTSPSPRRHGWLWRYIVNQADAIIAVREKAALFLDRHDTVIPHGVDTKTFVPPPDKLAAWRESGLPGKYGIGNFGRVRKSKGTDIFVEAMIRVLPNHPEFTAIITGFCKPGDEKFKTSLEQRIREAGLHERIIFLGDLRFEQIVEWYRRVSLCVAVPRSEGFGLTPLEAMACGAAALTSREGFFPQLIRPGVNGEIVDTGDATATAKAVERLISDSDALLRLGTSARESVLAEHSIEREVESIHAVYDQVCDVST